MVRGQLHDKGSGFTGEHSGLFEHDAGKDDGSHSDEIRAGGNPRGASEDSACHHSDKRNFSRAGDEGRCHDGHAAVALALDGTRRHNAGNAAARADQHGDEGLAGKPELAENTVKNESDTSHVAAGFKESEHQEQHEHLGNKAQHSADACDDTVKDKSLEPVGGSECVKSALDQDRKTGHPYSIVGTVHTAFVFFIGSGSVLEISDSGFVVLGGERFLVLYRVGKGVAIGISRLGKRLVQFSHGDGRVIPVSFLIKRLFERRCVHAVLGEFGDKAVDHRVGIAAVFLLRFLGLCGAYAEQMVSAVAEKPVVYPVGGSRSDGHHRDVIYQEHDDCEDRQTEPAVGHYLVDLVGSGERAFLCLFQTSLHNGGDPQIPLVGNNALGIVVKLGFGGFDVALDVLELFGGNVHLFKYLVVTLENLDGIPALLFLREIVDDAFLDVRQRVFHRAGEGVLRNGLFTACRRNRGFRRFHHAVTFKRGNLDHPAAELTGQLLGVDFVAGLVDHVHHIQRDDNRNSKLGELRGEVQVSFQIGAVNNVQNRVGALGDEVISRYNFLQCVGGERIDTRQVHDRHVVVLFELTFLLFDRDARPVADELIRACQGVEERRFAAVRVARQCNFYCHLYCHPFKKVWSVELWSASRWNIYARVRSLF